MEKFNVLEITKSTEALGVLSMIAQEEKTHLVDLTNLINTI